MKYAININGKIKIFNQLPKVWNNTIGYQQAASPEQIYKDGFREYRQPILHKYQKLGDIIFIEAIENDVEYYTREVIDNTPDAQILYDNLKDEAEDIYNEFRKLLMESTYESVLEGRSRQEVQEQVANLKIVKKRINDTLDYLLVNNDIENLKNFTFDTQEADNLRQAIKNLKE